mgnify:CR=1 FL=1
MFELAMILSAGGVIVFGPYDDRVQCANVARQIMRDDQRRPKPVYDDASCLSRGTTVRAQRIGSLPSPLGEEALRPSPLGEKVPRRGG